MSSPSYSSHSHLLMYGLPLIRQVRVSVDSSFLFPCEFQHFTQHSTKTDSASSASAYRPSKFSRKVEDGVRCTDGPKIIGRFLGLCLDNWSLPTPGFQSAPLASRFFLSAHRDYALLPIARRSWSPLTEVRFQELAGICALSSTDPGATAKHRWLYLFLL